MFEEIARLLVVELVGSGTYILDVGWPIEKSCPRVLTAIDTFKTVFPISCEPVFWT
jgi:hypothetical protein